MLMSEGWAELAPPLAWASWESRPWGGESRRADPSLAWESGSGTLGVTSELALPLVSCAVVWRSESYLPSSDLPPCYCGWGSWTRS